MRCARCGNDVQDNIAACPFCANGAPPAAGNRSEKQCDGGSRLCCPLCGSSHVNAVRRIYNPGCGCLGLLLFSWVGLLLGLLGGGRVDMVCADCGASWPAGRPGIASRGCLSVIVIGVIIAVMLVHFF